MCKIDERDQASSATDQGAKRRHVAALLRRCADRDEAAFSKLYGLTHIKMRLVAAKLLSDRSDIDDILQEAYLKIWSKAAQYDESLSSPISWMCRIVTNTAIDALRSDKSALVCDIEVAAESVADTLPHPTTNIEAHEQRQAALNAIETLAPDRKQLVLLAYVHEQTREALAETFGAPVSTIKTWLRRSIISMREIVERDAAALQASKSLTAA